MSKWRKAIQDNYVTLVNDCANPDDVAEYLYSGMDREILTESMKSEIKEKRTTKDKSREMLSTLLKRGPRALQGLYQAYMETGNEDLAELLIPYLEMQVKDDTKHTPSQWPPTKEEQERMEKDDVIKLSPKDPIVQLHYDSPEVYPMKAAVRGFALIINNEHFQKQELSQRVGTEKDSQNLKAVLEQLHFHVTEKCDATRDQILSLAKEFSQKEELKDHNCFLFAIFSHGNEEGIFGVDGQTIAVEKIQDCFVPINCPALNEKPKIFLIQACRGVQSEHVSNKVGAGDNDGLTEEMARLNVQDETDAGVGALPSAEGTITVHSESDFLFANATPAGNYSWRHKKIGSWFMQAIVWLLKYRSHKEHLEELLTKVADYVSRGKGNQGSVTVSEKKSFLRRKVYFFPGIAGDHPRNSKSMSVSTASPVVSPRHLYSGSYIQNVRRCGYNSQKLHFTDSKGVFAEHCREFDNTHKEYCMRVEKMKNSVQELQRDITLRRCLAKKTSVTDLQKGIDNLENDLEMHYVQTEQRQPALEKHWEEIVQQIANEQDLFQVQMHSVVKLKQEIGLLRTILTQLTSFVTSITVLTERLAPKLSQTCKDSDHDNTIAALFEEINTMQPDSQHRVDAIRQAQEERETLSASNRENPLDKELIKTKGLLRAPSARREGVSRRNSTKRESRELKDIPVQSPSDSSESKEETSKSQSPKCLDNSAGLDILPKNTQAVKSDSSECLNVTKNAEEIKDDLEGKNLEKNKSKSVRDSRESVHKHGGSCDPDVNENNKESKIPQHKSGSQEVDMSTQTDMLNSKDTSNSLESSNDVKTSRTAVKHQNDSDFSEGSSSLSKDDKCEESTESDKCAKGVRSASDSVDKIEKHEKSEIKVNNKSDRTSLSKCTEPPVAETPNKTDVCNCKCTKAEKLPADETSNVVDLSNSTEVEKPSGAVKSNKTDSSNSTEVKELLENS